MSIVKSIFFSPLSPFSLNLLKWASIQLACSGYGGGALLTRLGPRDPAWFAFLGPDDLGVVVGAARPLWLLNVARDGPSVGPKMSVKEGEKKGDQERSLSEKEDLWGLRKN